MLADLIKQGISTTGTGDLLLTAPFTGYISVATSPAYSNTSTIYYAVIDGDNKELGVGTYYTATNSVTRDTVFMTLDSGVFTENPITPLSLSGNAVFAVVSASKANTSHHPVWSTVTSNYLFDLAGVTAPTPTPLAGGVQVLGFSAGIQEAVGYSFTVPTSIDISTGMIPKIQWTPLSVDTGTVRWGIEYATANEDTGTFSSTTTVFLEQLASGILGKHQQIEGAAIAPLLPSGSVMVKLFRDSAHANDTFTGTAGLASLSLMVKSNKVGTPNRLANFYSW